MDEFKGTEGEWFAINYAGHFNIQTGEFYADNDNLLDCEHYPEEQVEANAKLMSSSPELLKALQEGLEFLGHIQPKVGEAAFEEIWNTFESALKKAI